MLEGTAGQKGLHLKLLVCMPLLDKATPILFITCASGKVLSYFRVVKTIPVQGSQDSTIGI